MIETEHIYPTLGTYVSEMHAPVINGRPRERIVRCRDCKHYAPVRMADGTEEHRCSGVMAFVRCTPGTFCAWGEAR